MDFERDECHKFCNWKTILCETNEGALKHLLKLTGKHLYRSLFFNEVPSIGLSFIEKRPMSVA